MQIRVLPRSIVVAEMPAASPPRSERFHLTLAVHTQVLTLACGQEQKVQAPKIAQVAAAGLAALFIAASPSFAADISVKAKLCATNPTSKEKLCIL